jgi:transcriptional regulator with XRE-family HTH domain
MTDDSRNLIRTWRRQLRMTQEEFAREIAVTVSTVNRWENNHAAPSKLAWRAVREFARRRGLIGNPFRKTPTEDEPTERAGSSSGSPEPAPVDETVPPALSAAPALAADWHEERARRASH